MNCINANYSFKLNFLSSSQNSDKESKKTTLSTLTSVIKWVGIGIIVGLGAIYASRMYSQLNSVIILKNEEGTAITIPDVLPTQQGLITELDDAVQEMMRSCLSDQPDQLYRSKLCHETFIVPYKEVIHGQCPIRSNNPPSVLAIMSNEGVSDELQRERLAAIPLKFINAGCDIQLKEAKEPIEICALLNQMKQKTGKPIDHLHLSMHGLPDTSFWKKGTLDLNTRFPKNCFNSLHPNATVSLLSCNTGTNPDLNKNLGQHMADETQRIVFAPKRRPLTSDLEVKRLFNETVTIGFVRKAPVEKMIEEFNDPISESYWGKGQCKEDFTRVFFPR